MNTIFKSIISVSFIFCFVALLSKVPNSIEISGIQISIEGPFLLVFFILTFVSAVGVLLINEQNKSEKIVYSVLGIVSTAILSRLWLSNVALTVYAIGLIMYIVSLFLGLFFSLWHQVLKAERVKLLVDNKVVLPVAARAFIRTSAVALLAFVLLIVAVAYIGKYFIGHYNHILMLVMAMLFVSPSIYELYLLVIGKFGTKTSKKAYQLRKKSLNKGLIMHNYEYQRHGWAPFQDLEQPLIYQYVVIGNLKMVKKRINDGDDPNSKNRVGWTILCQAVADGNIEIAKYLLEKGANPNVLNVTGRSPICYAALYGDEKMVKLLLEHNAQPNLYDFPEHRGPLHISIIGGHIGVVKLLLPKIVLEKHENNEFAEYKLALQTKMPELIELLAKKIKEQGDIQKY